MAQGTVKWFNESRGFGFISPADGTEDVFVHYSAIEGTGFTTLQEGESVLYEVDEEFTHEIKPPRHLQFTLPKGLPEETVQNFYKSVSDLYYSLSGDRLIIGNDRPAERQVTKKHKKVVKAGGQTPSMQLETLVIAKHVFPSA